MNTHTTLILDGIWGRPRRWRGLARKIASRVGPADIYFYPSSGLTPLTDIGRQLADHIRSLDRPVHLVAHSMGGLVLRAAHRLDPTLPIGRVCFMCSPLNGTNMAHLFQFLPAVRDMKPRSRFLKWVAEADDRWTMPTLSLWCRGDAVIIPNRSSDFHRSTHRIVSNVPAHNWPRWSTSLQWRITRFLAGEE
jgi:pimeloyl-ACP methyl ester carboxylesterase